MQRFYPTYLTTDVAFLTSQSESLRVMKLRACARHGSRGAFCWRALIQTRVTSPRTIPSSFQDPNLACNEIGDCGAEAFAAVLRLDCSLGSLDISDNSITVAGARRLSSAVEGNRTLDRLLVRAVARSREEQAELTALRQRHTCGPAGTRCIIAEPRCKINHAMFAAPLSTSAMQ